MNFGNSVAQYIIGSTELLSTLVNDMDSQKFAGNTGKRMSATAGTDFTNELATAGRESYRAWPIPRTPTRIGREWSFPPNPKSASNWVRFLNIIYLTILRNSNPWLWRWFSEMSDQVPDPTKRLYRDAGQMRTTGYHQSNIPMPRNQLRANSGRSLWRRQSSESVGLEGEPTTPLPGHMECTA